MSDWHETVEEHSRMVWQIAWRLLGNEADAADCLQETFLSALQVARREPVRHWPALLRRLATSRALDQLRRRMRQREQSQAEAGARSVARDPGPRELLEQGELVSRLREAMGQLPIEQAEVFCLYTLEGQSYREIAAALGLKKATVGVLLYRARRELRRILSDGENGTGSRCGNERSKSQTW